LKKVGKKGMGEPRPMPTRGQGGEGVSRFTWRKRRGETTNKARGGRGGALRLGERMFEGHNVKKI